MLSQNITFSCVMQNHGSLISSGLNAFLFVYIEETRAKCFARNAGNEKLFNFRAACNLTSAFSSLITKRKKKGKKKTSPLENVMCAAKELHDVFEPFTRAPTLSPLQIESSSSAKGKKKTKRKLVPSPIQRLIGSPRIT